MQKRRIKNNVIASNNINSNYFENYFAKSKHLIKGMIYYWFGYAIMGIGYAITAIMARPAASHSRPHLKPSHVSIKVKGWLSKRAGVSPIN